jgi:alpha-L-glutamate ligase-like protein
VDSALDQLETLDGFAMKPAKGSGGKGIWIIHGRHGEAFLKSSGAEVRRADLRRHISNTLAGLYSLGGGADAVIVEDLIRLDASFEGLSHEGIPDIRVIVFNGYPVMAMLRLATHASDGKANLHQGAVGVGLDLSSGRCASAVQFDRRIAAHPDTGKPLRDIVIRDWAAILELAARCFEMTRLGYLGTDIVIDRDRGPMLLEGLPARELLGAGVGRLRTLAGNAVRGIAHRLAIAVAVSAPAASCAAKQPIKHRPRRWYQRT